MAYYLRPLTAFLGSPDHLDSQDSSKATITTRLTRSIVITDAAGQITYEMPTVDTFKAADGHIRSAGYRRVGPWTDDEATVELIPASAKLKKAAIGLGVVALVIGGISFVAGSYVAPMEAAEKSCHEAVRVNLRAGATHEFGSTSVLNYKISRHGGILHVVSGDLRVAEAGGSNREMRYRCEVFVDNFGGVHKVAVETEWR